MIRRPPRSTLSSSSAASDVYKRQVLDDVALVSRAHHELLVPVVGEELHDVPQHRLAADFHHWLGTVRGLFTEARAETSSQKHRLHRVPHLSSSALQRTCTRATRLA